MNGSFLLRVLAFVCFVIDIILIVVKADAPTVEEVLIPLGLALWVLSTFVPAGTVVG